MRRLDPAISPNITISKIDMETTVENSSGAGARVAKSVAGLGYEAKVVREGDFLTFIDGTASPTEEPDLDRFLKRLARDYDLSGNIVPLETGRYDVLFDPQTFEDLVRPVAAMLDGRNIAKKTSPLTSRLRERIFDERITIIDDPHDPTLVGSTPFDDEGVATEKRALIDRGRASSHLLDLSSMGELGESRSGNGYRVKKLIGGKSHNALPQPLPTGIVMEPGEKPVERMIEDIKDGVYIKMLMGTILGDHVTGVVSGNVWLGFRIEKGELIGRIKNCMITFNVLDVLKNNVAHISKETEFHGDFRAPFLHLSDITISSQ